MIFNSIIANIKKSLGKITILKYTYESLNNNIIIINWTFDGRPMPPPGPVKLSTIKKYAKKFSLGTLIETGTFTGYTVESTKDFFKRIISIELDHLLFEQAKAKFSKNNNIQIIEGDSSNILPELMANINTPCLFWLDGHYSGGNTAKGSKSTPIINELNTIFNHKLIDQHVILIDDARCFTGLDDYPEINELKKIILQKQPNFIFDVKDDIIRIHNKI